MLSCQVAICPGSIVPTGTSCERRRGDDEKPGVSGRQGILLPTAVSESIAFRIPEAMGNTPDRCLLPDTENPSKPPRNFKLQSS